MTLIFRKPGSRVLSPRILELSMPTDSGPGQLTLKLESGAVIQSKRLRTLAEYTKEMDHAMAIGFVPQRREQTRHLPPESPEERQLSIGVPMRALGVQFAATCDDDDEETIPCRR